MQLLANIPFQKKKTATASKAKQGTRVEEEWPSKGIRPTHADA
jgi:hypothetical protein